MSEKTSETEQPFDFSSVHTDNFPKILKALNISLAVTSYQSSRLFFVRSDGETIDTNFKAFPRPMGVYVDEERLTLGIWTEVLDFRRNDAILEQLKSGSFEDENRLSRKVLEKESEEERAERLEKERAERSAYEKADALYIPRASHTTGMINIHDIAWGEEGLWVVNSTFSCLCTLEPDFSFVPRWKPHFISELVPEDRCHLNGMALKAGKPAYVTTFNKCDSKDSWHKSNEYDGTLMDVERNEILVDGLAMPHSPRWYEGFVYYCDSGRGLVCRYNPKTRQSETLIKLQGFPRGMNFYGPLMFVGLSQVRASDIRKPAPISMEFEETLCGLWIINLEDFSEVAHVKFDGDVEQIYDIAVVPNACAPELLEPEHRRIRHIFDFPSLSTYT